MTDLRQSTVATHDDRPRTWQRWSWLMVPAFAVRALRRRAGRAAVAALAANGLLVLLVAYQFVDAIRMSFFAPLD